MKLLTIVTRLNVGGSARNALALSPQLTKLGVDETVIAGNVGVDEADLGLALGIDRVIRLRALGRAIRPAADFRALNELRALIREIKPDIVHAHLAKAGVLGRVAGLRENVPVTAYTFHGHLFEEHFPRPWGSLIAALERRLARRTSLLLAVGEETRRDLARHGIADADAIKVVPVGLDLDPLLAVGPPGGRLRSELGIAASAKVVGFAGRFVGIKRLDRLLEAAGHVVRRIDAHFLFAGDGRDRYLLDEAARDDTLRGRIHVLGWVVDLRDFYEATDAVVLTSDDEGLPVSLIEGAAAGRPAVATRVGDVPAIVDNGATGVLTPRSASSVAEALTDVLTNPVRARAMGEAGRAKAASTFSAPVVAKQLVEIYEAALRDSRNTEMSSR